MTKGIGGHHKPVPRTNDWITPPHVIRALGDFDLDPCESQTQPWPCAENGYTIVDDGLDQEWFGRVYCNPPYQRGLMEQFMERLAKHRNGIGLIFGRTETQLFQNFIWQSADAILFLAGRLTFHLPDGAKARGNSGGPSVLVAYGKDNVECLRNCGLPGSLVAGWETINMG